MPTVDDATIQVATNGRFKQEPSKWAEPTTMPACPSIPHRYQVLSEIGRGGMGIVYKVRDIDTLEIVALKILKPEIAGEPAMRESLRKEVCLARKVTHKNVCRIYEFSRFESSACISMEWVDGESLLTKLRRKGALPFGEAVDTARQICAGLSEAHAQGIVHRDLKPANIVVADNHVVKIMDFGIARQAHDATQATTMMLAGTPAYMAPEQVESKAVTSRTDVYALGLLLYEMVTGQPAFSGESVVILALKQIREEPARPSSIVPTIPARLEAAILKCLEKNPEHRYSSVDELSTALESAFAPTATEKFSETVLEPAKAAISKGAQATASGLGWLAIELARAVREAERALRPRMAQWVATIRSERWLSPPVRTVQLTMLFGAALLSTSIVFAVVRSQTTHAAEHPLATAHANSSAHLSATNEVAFEPTATFEAKEFDFPSSDPPDRDAALTSPKAATPSLKPMPAQSASPAQPAALKSVAKAPNPHSPSLAAPSAPAPVNMLAPSNPEAAFADAIRNSPLPVGSSPGATALLSLLTLAPAVNDPDNKDAARPAPVENYLEVGTFNEPRWADDAVSKLAQLGFHAISVHKSRLWSQTYHVQVGPFQDFDDLEDAAQKLTAKGFKPHAVK